MRPEQVSSEADTATSDDMFPATVSAPRTVRSLRKVARPSTASEPDTVRASATRSGAVTELVHRSVPAVSSPATSRLRMLAVPTTARLPETSRLPVTAAAPVLRDLAVKELQRLAAQRACA